MKQLVPLLALVLTTPSAMANDTNDIWSYQDSKVSRSIPTIG